MHHPDMMMMNEEGMDNKMNVSMPPMPHIDMMKMYFHTGYENHVLFKSWHAKSVGEMFGACIAVFIASVLYEGLKYFREQMNVRATEVVPGGNELSSNSNLIKVGAESSFFSAVRSGRHIVQTLLHMVQVTLSYSLMLVFMTFNLWLCLALVLGVGLGYFLFGWSRATVADGNEHCH